MVIFRQRTDELLLTDRCFPPTVRTGGHYYIISLGYVGIVTMPFGKGTVNSWVPIEDFKCPHVGAIKDYNFKICLGSLHHSI